jgi:hypothetical protein
MLAILISLAEAERAFLTSRLLEYRLALGKL